LQLSEQGEVLYNRQNRIFDGRKLKGKALDSTPESWYTDEKRPNQLDKGADRHGRERNFKQM
jgi:hypothetical protein